VSAKSPELAGAKDKVLVLSPVAAGMLAKLPAI
jgi:hypothetical protein